MTGTNLQKWNRIIAAYWSFTGLFSLFMLMSCLSDLFKVEQAVTIMTHLGFPLYLMSFIGVAKLLGVVVLLVQCSSKLKEWAYVGFVFNLSGGFYAHISVGDSTAEWSRPLFFLVLLAGSYIFFHKKTNWQEKTGRVELV